MSSWPLFIQSFGKQQVTITATKNQGEEKWKTDVDEIDAILSLWMYDAMKFPKEGSSVGGTSPSAPEDSNRSTQDPGSKNMWLLGLNEAALRRDLKWWSDETLMASLVLAQDKDDMPSADESRDIQPLKDGCGGPPPDDALPSSGIEIESQRILGFGNIKDPHRQKTGFIINDIGEKPQDEDGSKNQLAVLSSAPLALLGAQKILSAFMKLVAERLTSSIQGTTSVRHVDSAELSAGGSSWQSFTLQNAILLKLVQDLQRTGIGSLQEVYLCIIPPLSAEERLPDASAVIEFARQRSEQHELHDQWDRSVDIYIWLFRTAKSFTSSNIFARRATATVMVFFRSALIEEEISVDQDLCMATTNGSTPRRTSRTASKLRQELDNPELEEYSRHVLSLFSLQRKVHSRGRQTPLDWKPFNLQSKDVQRGGRSDDLYHVPTRFTELHSRCFFKTPSDSDSVAISEQIRSPDILGLSPIHYAASPMASYPSSGDKTYVSVLLDAGADGNVKDPAGWTPLHYNCLWGGAAQFRELMSEGLDIEARARDGTTLLHCAAIGNNPAAARRLIEAGVNIKARDSSRSTPLHWAAYYGNLDVLNVLVQAGGVKERNNDGRTPAHLAALGGHVGVLKVILGEVSSMEDKDRSGFTMLHLAAAKGRTELIEFLVGAEKVTDAQVAGGGPHESSSTSARNADVSAALTRRISDIEAADAKGFRPLHWAANSCSGDSAGHVLVSRGANLHATDEGGRTPLDICAVSGNAKFARYLVKKGACTDASVEALRHVARARDFEMLKVFFDTQGRPSDHLFHRAIEAGNLESIKFLISQNANMDASDSDPEGATALHIAASAKDYRENVFQLLVDHGAILDAKDKSGQAVVHKAVRMGHYDLVKFLIDKGVDLNSRDRHGNTALHAAVLEVISSKICKLIAESGVDLNLCNEEGRTALHDTARLNKPDLMAILIDIKGVDINVQDVNGMTAMHYIASLTGHGSLHPTITLLTENGADLNLKDKHNSAPIHTAAMRGEHDTMYAMIGKGANPNAKDGHGRTALHIAAQKHDYEMIVNLISLGVNMNLRDNRGRSAIHCTVAHNIAAETILKSVEALTDEGANINTQDSYGRTILHHALKTNPKGINKLFDFFITKLKADIKIRDNLKRTILHYSSFDIENSLVEFFLPRGTDLLNALDVKGYTALHFACFESKPEFVRFLLGNSADFRICVGSWSPLHLTILSYLTGHQKSDCVEIAKTLIAEGIDQSWKDQDGRTALDMAVILEDQDFLQVFQSSGIAAASDESVSEINDGQAVIDWEDIPSKIDENAGAPADEGSVEKIDEDDGENCNEDDCEGRDEGFGESINQDIGSPTHDNVGALSEDAEEDVNSQSTNEQLAATDRHKGFSESTDERDLIVGGNIKLGRDEVVSESTDKKVIKAGEDKRKLLEAAEEIYAYIRRYRNKEDIDVE